eukprot:2907267-Rhodomonas_salina.3
MARVKEGELRYLSASVVGDVRSAPKGQQPLDLSAPAASSESEEPTSAPNSYIHPRDAVPNSTAWAREVVERIRAEKLVGISVPDSLSPAVDEMRATIGYLFPGLFYAMPGTAIASLYAM